MRPILYHEVHSNFQTYRTDRSSNGPLNYGGTVVLVRRNISHNLIQISIVSIEKTIIQIKLNGKELRLSTIYKSLGKPLLCSDLDLLINFNSDINIILAGDLNAKNTIWHSNTNNTAGNIQQTHLKRNFYLVITPDSPTHFPDIRYHKPDILDIALIKLQISCLI